MKRRHFLRSSLGAGVAAGALVSFGGYQRVLAGKPVPPGPSYDLIAVMNGEPAEMFDMGIQALGGMGSFVSKGQKVLVKPNIGWDVVPEKGANTNPALVKRVIEHCLRAGAREVYVFDHTCDDWMRCYKNSGIEAAVKSSGGKIVPGNAESYYQEVALPNSKKLTKVKVHEMVLDSDVFINIPVLKHHSSTRLSGALKNMMGVVWDRGYWHGNNLNQCIADYALYAKKPNLNIMDAYNVMMRNGPRGVSKDDLSNMKSLLLSTDGVALDAAGAKMMGLEPDKIEHLAIAAAMGVGKIDLTTLNIHRIKM